MYNDFIISTGRHLMQYDAVEKHVASCEVGPDLGCAACKRCRKVAAVVLY